MEFMLLQDNQVAVRDCSIGSTGLKIKKIYKYFQGPLAGGVSLADFWRAFQQQSQESEDENQGGSSTSPKATEILNH